MTTAYDDEIIDRLDSLVRENHALRKSLNALGENFNFRMKALVAEFEVLRAMVPHPVPFKEEFPPLGTFKLTKAQLFHNEPNHTGKRGGFHPTEWRLKLGFWTHSCDVAMYPDGTVQPYFCTMRAPDQVRPAAATSLLAQVLGNGSELVGCREIKGPKRAKGTRLFESQVALIFPSDSDGRYPARALIVASEAWNDVVVLTDPFITSSETRKPGTPVEVWTKRFDV
jgi:hypothetical protein